MIKCEIVSLTVVSMSWLVTHITATNECSHSVQRQAEMPSINIVFRAPVFCDILTSNITAHIQNCYFHTAEKRSSMCSFVINRKETSLNINRSINSAETIR